MSRVRPSYNPWTRLNHYPPLSQESNERTMDGSERTAREEDQTKWRGGNGGREREMEWRLLIENEQENGGKRKEKKKKKNKHTGRRTTLTPLWQRQIYMLARALVGGGWRAKGNLDKDFSWPKPSCRVQHSDGHTLYACSSISITITANPREFTGACHAMDSRCMQAATLAFSSHLAIHNIHPSIHPPVRSWRST